ncbi:hypothetical protein [Rhodococcus sp. C3V]|uniref:hypothetical protein n=1 Tax=Rhodococcus sp. C3V TaxID=3034165 RepID=UPI0023E27FD5|nr:hypothetical protein [Rhodococcus sp. C3V]MDF3316389.1 hypothetical protein [Rhodococcus sp. C3V]
MDSTLDKIITFYLDSRDFNGLPIRNAEEIDLIATEELVRRDLVQVVDERDYLNPHIRPWKPRRTTDDQIESLRNLTVDEHFVCLYPTVTAMEGYDLGDRYKGLPYDRVMAEGHGTLELAFFKYEVLEPYRNDPRFVFQVGDYGVDIWLSDDLYMDESEPEMDKIAINHVGFAYDLSKFDKDNPDSEIKRLVCAFYVDLRKLNSVHQLRWSTYEIEKTRDISPHLIWWRQQMGHWPDGMGPFERFFYELETLNILFERAHGDVLLNTISRPDGFGWIVRPSQSEYDAFVHQLDKLLSENLRYKALDLLGVEKKNNNGEQLGTLTRLELALRRFGVDEAQAKAVLRPLRDVRRLRQKPAHTLTSNVTNSTFVHHQASLLREVTDSIESIRRFWQTHPTNADWDEPDYAAIESSRYWL